MHDLACSEICNLKRVVCQYKGSDNVKRIMYLQYKQTAIMMIKQISPILIFLIEGTLVLNICKVDGE